VTLRAEDHVDPRRRANEVEASRARILAAADESRRRLHRDLHDGTQQRLVHTVIALKLARGAVEPGSTAAALVEEALGNAEQASRELRDVVRNILPSSLVYGGLRVGLESLVADLGLPVELRCSTPRLPPPVETSAYLVVAEALTNTVVHSRARRAQVDVGLEGDILVVEVRDDGVGGADATLGTGLTGLMDRLDAAGGSLAVRSPRGGGTSVRAELPVRPGDGGTTPP
jgi:signal transduction histidine kinase